MSDYPSHAPKNTVDDLYEELREMLRSEDSTVRRVAIAELPELGDRAIPMLVKTLQDDDFGNVQNAAFALGEMGSEAAVKALLGLFGRSDQATQVMIFTVLGMIGGETAVSWLLYILSNNRDWNYQIYAARALGEIGDPRAVPQLIEVMNTGWRDVRSVAADALGRIGDEAAVPPLLEALHAHNWSKNGRFPFAVTRALANIGGKMARQGLSDALHSADFEVQQAAAEAAMYLSQSGTMVKRPRPALD
jgi:HEAT repeat protein